MFYPMYYASTQRKKNMYYYPEAIEVRPFPHAIKLEVLLLHQEYQEQTEACIP